jgi:hypothetical protein
MQKLLKCQASRNLSHLTLCIILMLPCLVSGKEKVSKEAFRKEQAQRVPESVRRTVPRAHRLKAITKQTGPNREAVTNGNKIITASSVTPPTNRSNGQFPGAKPNAAWSADTRLISNPPVIRFEKPPEYKFEEDSLPGIAKVNLLMDRNNDGMIDPMEYSLGWIGMTDVGDVGLRKPDMAMERMWLQDRNKPGHMTSPERIHKNKPRAVSSQRSVKRHTQKSL